MYDPAGQGPEAALAGVLALAARCPHLTVVTNEVFSGGADYEGDTLCLLYTSRCRLGDLAAVGREAGVRRTALVLVGDFLRQAGERSRLYDPTFSTGYREAEK